MNEPPGTSRHTPAEQREAAATVLITRYRGLYEATGNAVHALRAFECARRFNQPIPDWVLEYFDRSIAGLFSGPATMKAVAPAFGLAAKAGPFATTRAHTDNRNLYLIQMVDNLKARDPQTLSPSARQELELNGVFWFVGDRTTPKLSGDTVQEIYYEVFRDEPAG